MELLKQYVRRNGTEKEGQLQITMEEDVNLPEMKPDVNTICLEKGSVLIEEVQPMADAVTVRGKLTFSVLYHTQEYGGRLECMEGKLPFEEKIRVEGLLPSDDVVVTGMVEDLTISMINSRKLGVQSVLSLEASAQSIQDEELPIGVTGHGQEDAQIRLVPMEYTELALCSRDVMRIKEELSLPSGQPNVARILWKSAELGEMNFRLGEEQLYAQGEVRVFVLYESEDGNPEIYETTVEESTQIACSGCHEGMALDVRYGISQWELTPKPDLDGEMRDFGLEMTVTLRICVYEEKKLDVVTDVYGVKEEILEEKKTASLRRLLRSVTGKTKVLDHVTLEGVAKPLQLIRGEGSLSLTDVLAAENGLRLRGSLGVKILYVTGDDEKPYGCVRKTLPYEYVLEIPGLAGEDVPERVQATLERFSVTMQGSEEMEVKAILCFVASAFHEEETQVLGEIAEAPLDQEKMASLPGMAIYVVRPGEHLWNVGKKYYVPIQSLKDLNNLTSEELVPGQKLLVVKRN